MLKKTINFLKNIKKVTETFESKLEVSNRTNYLLNSALTSNESIISSEVNNKELIVSLTTYSKRIHDVHLIIESIAHQTLKPNRIILWLDEEEFNLETIPLILKKQIERGLEVRFCPDYKSYKKLIPTLELFPDASIITIDDDIIYPHDMVEILVRESKIFPRCIIGHRAHLMKFDKESKLLSYNQWEHESTYSIPSFSTFITTGGGTLFPAKCFSKTVFDSDTFLNLCPNADDVWFSSMAILNGVKSKKVDDTREFWKRFLLIDLSQDIALFHENKIQNGNDIKIKAVFKKYDLYNKLEQ
ncbi:glycosyl transferase [Pseudoalteromonas sp. Xi13]|uniref:glycosyl transferase n=1 Tax=Pseudoalteromonas sp. Xi13 TaxID=2490635 RepID=UPI000F750D9C|nr:glycosyl transferase [Pseudoalteromonas sp. Xi13]AZN31578.1 glycosyl transferase [Pseudoalteromonas sp. Xi13]